MTAFWWGGGRWGAPEMHVRVQPCILVSTLGNKSCPTLFWQSYTIYFSHFQLGETGCHIDVNKNLTVAVFILSQKFQISFYVTHTLTMVAGVSHAMYLTMELAISRILPLLSGENRLERWTGWL